MSLHTQEVFRGMGVEARAYALLFVAVMFSGSLYGSAVPYLVLVAIGLLLWMSVTMPTKRASATISRHGLPQVALLLLFSLFLLWQLSMAYVPWITQVYVQRFLVFSVLLVVVPRIEVCVVAIKAAKYWAFIVAVSIIVLALVTGERTGGLVGDYQFGGMMMSIACILFLIDYFYDGANAIDVLGFSLALTGLFVSGKRMFTLLALLAFAVLYLLSRREKVSSRAAKVLGAAVSVLAPMYFFFEPVRVLVVRMGLLTLDEYAATSGRNLLWAAAMDIFRANPVAGIGFGNFASYVSDQVNIRGADYVLTHNIYYGLLAETGVIGFSLVVGLLIFTLVQSWQLLRAVRESGMRQMFYVMIYSVSLQAWFILYGFTGNGIYDWHEFFFYVSAVAMMISVKTRLASGERFGASARELGDTLS